MSDIFLFSNYRQAEALKAAVQDVSKGANEAWVSRQNLQDLYQKLLVLDLEYALDKKVEQDLWNHAFKNQINTLQTQAKDKQNPKRPEIVASLNLFLETASGFYIQLLEELCSAFKLDLPCRRKSANIGILKEYGPVAEKVKVPKQSSCLYICQHCLVHLGDIARYREQSDQAQTYYRHAASLVPYNGQPYNQLAILEAAKGNKLSTVVYYIRSIAVKHPFPVACTNLEKLYAKITRDVPDHSRKLSMIELVTTHLQFNALIHLCKNLDKAKMLSQKILISLPSHITSMSFTSHQLIQLITVNLFTMSHARRKLTDQSMNSTEKADLEKKEELGMDERRGYDLVFNMTMSLLEVLLNVTPKQEVKTKDYHTLPSIKVLLDWIHADKDIINSPDSKMPSICHNLSKLLNNLQFSPNQKDAAFDLEKYLRVPLPEDCELRCFIPMVAAHCELDFQLMPAEGLSANLEMHIRCQRLVEHGLWLCDEFPSLNLMNVQKQKSGHLFFSSPIAMTKSSSGTDPEKPMERKSYRQNVAIQAIMQNKSRKENMASVAGEGKDDHHGNKPSSFGNQVKGQGSTTGRNASQEKPGKKEHKSEKPPKKSDAGIMAHSATDTQEPKEKPIPPDAWNHPASNLTPTAHVDFARPPLPAGPFMKGRPQLPPEFTQQPPLWPPMVITQPPLANFYPHTVMTQQNNKENQQYQYPGKHQGQDGFSQGQISEKHQMKPMDDPVIISYSKDLPQTMMAGLIPMYPESKGTGGISDGTSAEHQQQDHLSSLQKLQLQQQHQQQIIKTQEVQDPKRWLPQQQQQHLLFQRVIYQLDEQILKTAKRLEQVGQMVQQKSQTMQQDPEIQVLHQRLQQLHMQKKSTMDPCQLQHLKTVITQNQQNLIMLVHQYQNQIVEQQQLQQQLQHQLIQLQQQRRQKLAEAERVWPPEILAADDRPPRNSLPAGNLLPGNMDLSQMMAVLEVTQGSKQLNEPWNKADGSETSQQRSGASLANRPNNLPIGSSEASSLSPVTPYLGTYSQFGKSSPNEAAKSFLESLLSGSFGAEKSSNGAYFPESDSDDELKQISDELTVVNDKSALESLLSSTFPVSLPVDVDLSLLIEEVPKPDSPPSSISSLYTNSQSSEATVPTTNTYSLFSQSPWTVQLTSVDSSSHPSSPFGSSEGSVRTTPDPYSSQSDDRASLTSTLGTNLGFGFNFQPANNTSEGWRTPVGGAVEKAPGGSTGPHRNMQNLWTSGASPLQKLLEQQKCHRQNDPH
ncbi:hypothetical protein LSH36_156g11043 [Paralvinella palmiformis]|uniref:Protein SMG7 n=1 Tax=Paralvinella palmiformis TaxID=53620 RepID=A0AAD9JVV7_9ANNE|nr:hypothetical protein LSH36_156g11043 [Paralvinella palmiformis]